MKKAILLVCIMLGLSFVTPMFALAESNGMSTYLNILDEDNGYIESTKPTTTYELSSSPNDKEGYTSALTNKTDTKMTEAKSAYLTDSNFTEEIYEYNSQEKYPIASMVKMMTLLIAFEEIDSGRMSLDEKIQISHKAMSMGGSQMFLSEGLEYPLSDLILGIVVASANDACVAVAERISGSEGQFINRMNDRAKELKMTNTNFVNCTGLPCINGYSCAHDCAVMLSELLKHERYHDYSTVWLENYTHPDGRTTVLTNTNKLIRFYKGCDGGKTGFTNEAGFCLTATAVRDGVRVISVVIGESDSTKRFEDTKRLLNYAFANYTFEALAVSGEQLGEIRLKGAKNAVGVTVSRDIGIFTKRGGEGNGKLIVELSPDKKAPFERGSVVGSAFTVKNGKECDRADIILMDDVEKESYGDAIGRVMGGWSVKSA